MRKAYLITLCFLSTTCFISCGSDENKKKLDSLYYRKEELIKRNHQYENELQHSGNNNEINNQVSSIGGYPVTNGQIRREMLRQNEQELEEINAKIEHLKN